MPLLLHFSECDLPEIHLLANELFTRLDNGLAHAFDRNHVRVEPSGELLKTAAQLRRRQRVRFLQNLSFQAIDKELNEHQNDGQAECECRCIEGDIETGQ